ncbi:MAG: hypothetical protein JSS81_01540 [Acidobacteria bacterium]|nr:hypothetical protein [Acidobacteriota bacterium]
MRYGKSLISAFVSAVGRGSHLDEWFRGFSALALLALLAAAAAAQSTGDSVFIINQTTTNNSAGVVADYVAGEIGEGLQNQFPCVDYSSPEDVKAVLDAARDKQLLTGELSQEQLAAIGGAIGARYVVLVSVTVLPNGQTVVNARLLDTKTTSVIASESETAADAEAAFANAESVANKILQSFARIFKNKCEPHWTGTITQTRLIQMSETQSLKTSTETKSKNLTATVNILLQPMTLGFSGRSSAEARVTQNFSYREEFVSNQSTEIPCREPGRNTYNKKVTGEFRKVQTEVGGGTEVVTVFVRFFDDGRYTVYASGFKPVKTAVRVETKSNPAECRPVPASSVRETEDSKNFAYINLEGRIDPKNPDVLTGKKVEGDLQTGQQTWTWSLRLVNPNKKKR